jgi:hypothetical protein
VQVQLPKTACLNPSPSFYKQFNGYTLGLVCAMLGMTALHVLGTKVVSRLSLRGLSEEERIDRVAKFSSLLLARALLVLYIVYPGVSVAIFSMFSCTKLESGVAYLDADFNITCYDRQHWKYMGAAIVWLFIVPLGVPAFFIWLLRAFKVPQMAKLINDSAWVREAVQLAWQSGMAQPACNVAKLNVDSISDAHLEGLYALFVRGASVEAAGDIANGTAPALPDEVVPESPPPTGAVLKALAQLMAAATRVAVALHRIKLAATKVFYADAAVHGEETPEQLRRAFVLQALLGWCQTSGKLALPAIAWDAEEEEEEEETHLVASAVEKPAEAGKARAKASAAVVRCEDLPRLKARALKEVGFLFGAYHTGTWCAEKAQAPWAVAGLSAGPRFAPACYSTRAAVRCASHTSSLAAQVLGGGGAAA